MCILHVRHRCRPSIIIGRTWDDVRAKVRKQRKVFNAAKVRKQRKVWSARRARWQTWKSDGRNATGRGVILRKGRKKKKPGVKSVRVLRTQEPGHVGPRYNISSREADKAYRGMRKGRGF